MFIKVSSHIKHFCCILQQLGYIPGNRKPFPFSVSTFITIVKETVFVLKGTKKIVSLCLKVLEWEYQINKGVESNSQRQGVLTISGHQKQGCVASLDPLHPFPHKSSKL